MAKLLRLRRGTDTQHTTFTGAEGEVTVNTTNDSLHVHDGTTAGGRELMRADKNNMPNSGVTAGTYGSSSAIPSITVDAKGLVTSATTSAIDSTAITNGTSNVSVAASGDITATRAGTTRLTVTNSGIDVNGSASCDGLTCDGELRVRDSGTPELILQDTGQTANGATARIKAVDSAGTVRWNIADSSESDGDLTITNNFTAAIEFASGGSTRCKINSAGHFLPGANNSYDLGESSNQWRNGWFDGTVNCDGFQCEGTAQISTGTGILQLKDSDSTGNANVNYVQGFDSNGSARWYVGHASTSNQWTYLSNQVDAPIVFETNGTIRAAVQNNGHFVPWANNTYDLGTTDLRWRNVYTNDLNLSNEGGANDVDGTWGSWTIQEGEDDLFLLNRRNGKKYKFNLSEVN